MNPILYINLTTPNPEAAAAKVCHRLVCEIASGFWQEFKSATGMDSDDDMLESAPLIKKLHRSSKTRHENQTTEAYAKHGLAAQVPISYDDLGGLERHPWLRPSDYIRVFVNEGKLGLLMGESGSFDVVQEFWRRYERIQPQHPVFKLDPEELKYTLPCMLYADEGSTLKKQSLMVVSLQPVLGKGTYAAATCQTNAAAMGVNFLGSCYKTRFLISVLAKRFYKQRPQILDALVKFVVEDCNALFDCGIGVSMSGVSKKIRICILALKGDWPILARLGHLTRSFHKQKKGGKDQRSAMEGGICHLCKAGCPAMPYQEYTEAAKWCGTFLSEPPFDPDDPSPLLDLRQAPEKELLYQYDVFHTLHKGVCAELAGSAIASRIFVHVLFGFRYICLCRAAIY